MPRPVAKTDGADNMETATCCGCRTGFVACLSGSFLIVASVALIIGVYICHEYAASVHYADGAVCRIANMTYSSYDLPCTHCKSCGKSCTTCEQSSFPCLVVGVAYSFDSKTSPHSAFLYHHANQQHGVRIWILVVLLLLLLLLLLLEYVKKQWSSDWSTVIVYGRYLTYLFISGLKGIEFDRPVARSEWSLIKK